jgi:hypothetical protein
MAMDWWLNIVGNILQIVTSVGFFVAAFKWGRDIMSQHNIWWGALLVALALSVTVGGLSLGERLGWLPASKMEIVSDRHFRNEVVVLDNHAFYSCVFENITFTYGGGPVFLYNPKFIGPGDFRITNEVGSRIVQMMISIGVLQKQPQAAFKMEPAK